MEIKFFMVWRNKDLNVFTSGIVFTLLQGTKTWTDIKFFYEQLK